MLKKKSLTRQQTVKAARLAVSTAELSGFSRKKREQILQAAIETFLEFGYEGSSMSLVAERAGVIKQTIYSHFSDKETLFVKVIAAITIDQAQHVFAPGFVEGRSPEEVLRALGAVLESRTSGTSYAKLLRTIVGESARFPTVARLFTRATVKPGIELLTRYFTEHPQINLPDPEAFARIFISSLVHHCMLQNVLYGKTLLPFKSSRLIDELIRVFKLSSTV